MGMFEDAQRDAQRAHAERVNQAAEAGRSADYLYQEQTSAVAEFIDAMHRLQIPPLKHHFWQPQRDSRFERYVGHSVTGWLLNDPRRSFSPKRVGLIGNLFYLPAQSRNLLPGFVVSSDGLLYQTAWEASWTAKKTVGKPVDLHQDAGNLRSSLQLAVSTAMGK